jgi:hypothetical protein
MFIRVIQARGRRHLQIVENRREGKRTVLRVIANLGHLGQLKASDEVDTLLRWLARFADQVRIVEGHRQGCPEARGGRDGPAGGGGRPTLAGPPDARGANTDPSIAVPWFPGHFEPQHPGRTTAAPAPWASPATAKDRLPQGPPAWTR